MKFFLKTVLGATLMFCCFPKPLLPLSEMEPTNMKKEMELLISPQEIAEKLKEVASQIDQDYQGKELCIVMLMKGAVFVTADLMRNLHVPVTLDYIKASSYGKRGSKQGELIIEGIENLEIQGKDVLLIDDIFDTGKTMTSVLARLKEKEPSSLKTLVLLVKNTERRKTDYMPDYGLFTVDDHFVIGYGLDYSEYFRELSGIYRM